MLNIESILGVVKFIILGSIFFVWVVRYQNIINEFKQFNYPDWLRDLVGILKISFAMMLFSPNNSVVMVGAIGIVSLMVAALMTHMKIRNPVPKMLPAFTLMSLSLSIFFLTS